ncbi:hypothetical protein [Gimesia benthica]|uniref:hypothetical protein n=1 Tax=Gimesia benthica TaxID=2608982 RepID=UPI0036F20712
MNHFIAFGQRHFDYLVSEFVDYYNKHRAQSSREHLPPCCAEPPSEFETIRLAKIHCKEHLRGLIESYEQIAAYINSSTSHFFTLSVRTFAPKKSQPTVLHGLRALTHVSPFTSFCLQRSINYGT